MGQAAGIAALNALAAQHLPETLLRIRGEWALSSTASIAGNNGAAICMGLILVPEGTGTTALWSPITDGDAPWIWWDCMHLIYEEYVANVVQSSQTSSGRRVIDSKAMRKVRNSELQLVVENATISGMSALSVNAVATGRVLAGS